jgi:hypothetical protein
MDANYIKKPDRIYETTFLRKLVYVVSTLPYLFVILQCCMPCEGRHTFMRRPVGKYTYNVTLRCVRLPMVACGKQ